MGYTEEKKPYIWHCLSKNQSSNKRNEDKKVISNSLGNDHMQIIRKTDKWKEICIK